MSLFFGIIVLKFINDVIYSKYVSTVFHYRGFISEFKIDKYLEKRAKRKF